MEATLKEKLVKAGVSEAALKILEEQELTTEEALQGFTYEKFVTMGIKAGSANILAKMYAPKSAPVSPETTPASSKTTEPGGNPESDKSVASQLGIDMATMTMFMAGSASGMSGSLADLIDPVTLLGAYNPKKPTHLVTRVLKAAFGSKPVIAFKPGTLQVAVEETAAYIRELEEGEAEVEFLTVSGQPVPLYPVGVAPDNLKPENPLYPSETLRGSEERCANTNMAWRGIETEKRQFARIAMGQGEVTFKDLNDRSQFIETLASRTMEELRKRFPKTSIEFDHLKARDELPRLLVEVGERKGRGPAARPFRPREEDRPAKGEGFQV